jgi:hypothetical protein
MKKRKGEREERHTEMREVLHLIEKSLPLSD